MSIISTPDVLAESSAAAAAAASAADDDDDDDDDDEDGLDKLHKFAIEYNQYRLNKLTLFGKSKLSYSRRKDIIIKSYGIKYNH